MSVALQRTMRTNRWVWKFGHKQRRIRGEFRSEVACSRQQARRYRGAGFRGRGVRVSLFRSIPCLLPTMAYGNVGCCNVREVILYGHVPSSWFDNTRIYSGSMQSPLFSIPLQHCYQEKCLLQDVVLNRQVLTTRDLCTPFSIRYPQNMG